MSDNMEHKDLSAQTPSSPLMNDCGVASEITHGIPFITPWFENGIPPYNYWVPVD